MVRPCGKKCYSTERQADIMISIICRTSKEAMSRLKLLNAYKCYKCKAWHIGHSSK